MIYSKYETLSRDEMRELQSERLKTQVARVYENVPLYRERMDAAGVTPGDIRSIDDLSLLPFTCKQDLRDTYPYGMFAVPMSEIVRLHASSGTTGKQVVVGYTKKDLAVWGEVGARALTSVGMTKDDLLHVSYGYGLFTGGLGMHLASETLGSTTIPVSTGNTKRQIQIMQDFGSSYICCTPSYMLYIAETLEHMGIEPSSLKLRGAILGAEPWTEEMRVQIEERMKLKAYDIYGLTEIMGPGVSVECEHQCGTHVQEDHFFPEIIDPETGKVLPDGASGELVFTCLTKEGFPLLRYRTRDICRLDRTPCACGRTTVRMARPAGRTDDMLIIRGVNVFPSQIEAVLISLGLPPYYQIEVERVGMLDELTVVVEMSDAMFTDEVRGIEALRRRIAGALNSTLGIAATVRLVEPRTIQRTEGKAVHVIDKRKLY